MTKRKSLRRTSVTRTPKKKILVFFEGRRTERLYINGLRKELRRKPVHIEPGPAHGEPLQLVRKAIRRADEVRSGDAYDEVWCLLDVETPPHGSLDSALSLARKNGVNCAISNPCFELWLLLHVATCNRYTTTNQMINLTESKLSSYREKSFEFDDIRLQIGDALQHALDLEDQHDTSALAKDKNPSTSMWKFIQMLQEYGEFEF